MHGRVAVRQAIIRRDALAAIGHIEGVQPELLHRRPDLLFRLHQQHVVDLLLDGHDGRAWEHAAVSLVTIADDAARGGDPSLLRSVDATALLFVCCLGTTVTAATRADESGGPHSAPHLPSPLPPSSSSLLSADFRLETARTMNRALLAAEGSVVSARLPALLAMLASPQLKDGRLGDYTAALGVTAAPTAEGEPEQVGGGNGVVASAAGSMHADHDGGGGGGGGENNGDLHPARAGARAGPAPTGGAVGSSGAGAAGLVTGGIPLRLI